MSNYRQIKKILRLLLNIHNVIYNKLVFNIFSVKTKSHNINGRIYIRNKGEIFLGKGFRANSGMGKNPIGGDTVLRLITQMTGCIEIGDNVGISNSTIFSTEKIIIGSGTLIGGGVKIWDTDFHSIDPLVRNTRFDKGLSGQITIGKNVFIGGGSIILKGVNIGDNSVIAAHSVVSKSIPENEIWGGNPVKFIRSL